MLVSAVWLWLSGCATPHLYPICFYNDGRPEPTEFTEYYLPKLKQALGTAGGLDKSTEITGTPDGRWLIANVTDSENSNVARVWSRVGCIGNANNSIRVANEAACVSYVANFVTKNEYNTFATYTEGQTPVIGEGVHGSTVLHCQTVTTKSDR
jgi:hypothetical protein